MNCIFLNDKNKKLSRTTRNYFFVVTVLIVLTNILIFALYGYNVKSYSVRPNWDIFSVANLFQSLVNSYSHANWQHVLLNMVCFFIVGLYLERKQGSIKFLFFMVIMSFFTAFSTCTNYISLTWHGFSGINYGLFGFVIIDFLGVLLFYKRENLLNVILGIIMMALIYWAMCFNGGTKSIGFEWYPYDLLHNLGHASGFVAGLMLGVYEVVSCFIFKRSSKD